MEEEKKYDLEQRTETFSLRVRDFCSLIKKDVINLECSVGANYIEANDNLGVNDLKMRIRICRKESKESRYWLKHMLTYESEKLEQEKLLLYKKQRN